MRSNVRPSIRSLSFRALSRCSVYLAVAIASSSCADPASSGSSSVGAATPDPGGVPGSPDGQPPTCGADLKTDPANCGACGHDCGGGKCEAGICGTVELYRGGTLSDLAIGPLGLWWVTFEKNGAVNLMGMNPPGATIERVDGAGAHLSVELDGLWVRSKDIAVHKTTCCVPGDRETVWLYSPSAKSWNPWVDLSNGYIVQAVEIDESYAYGGWVGNSLFMLFRKSVPEKHEPLGNHYVQSNGLSLGDADLFAATSDDSGETSTLLRISKSTLKATPLTSGPAGTIGTTKNTIYGTKLRTGSGLAVYVNDAGIAAIPTAGGNPTQIVATRSTVTAIAVDEDGVYWAELPGGPGTTGGVVMQARRDGSAAREIAKGDRPTNIVTDAKAIYWLDTGTATTQGGVFMKHKDR